MAEPKALFNRIRAFIKAVNDRGLATYAASCAFYSFLSLFPMAVLAASLIPCVGVSEAALVYLLGRIAPASVMELIRAILANVYENVFPALPLSLLVLLWSSAQAFSELLKGMAAMAGHGRATGYLRRRLRAILLTLAMLLTLLLSLVVLVFGGRVALMAGLLYPRLAHLLNLVLWLRYGVMLVLFWLLFVLLYRSIPGQRLSFREVRLGAALAAAAWMLFSFLFSLYAGQLLDLTLYGSMAALALTMLWLFYCQYILLVGAALCARKKEAVSLKTAS